MSMKNLRHTIRESLGNIWRELKITLTPAPKPEKWVFIVGCYNSGTTLLAELLGTHPAISALPTEGHFITDEFIKDYDVGLPRMWVGNERLFRLTENDLGPDASRIKREWAMRLDTQKTIFLEKSPPNSARTRWLQKHFENAHFIGIVRNGYAVAEGIKRKAKPQHVPEGWSIAEAIWQWKRGNEILFADAKNLKNYMQISYEDLAADTDRCLDSITKFLEITPFHEKSMSGEFKIHERSQAVENLNSVSIKNLTNTQIKEINAIASDMLDDLGYFEAQ